MLRYEPLEITCFKDLIFDEPNHRYFYSGYELISVTTVIKEFYEKFDPEVRSKNCSLQRKGFLPDWVKQLWECNGIFKGIRGTEFHLYAEVFLKSGLRLPFNTPIGHRVVQFHKFIAAIPNLKPVAIELRIFSTRWKVAGTIDNIFQDINTGLYYIIDWKTDDTMEYVGFDNKMMFEPFQNLPDSNFYHHCVQQNIYKHIIEEYVGIKISDCFLAHFPMEEKVDILKCIDIDRSVIDDAFVKLGKKL
jgi:hypothetical protein